MSGRNEVRVGLLSELDDPGCREFSIGDGDWPFKGFVVRLGERVYAYQNFCMHVGHPLNWKPNDFLTKDKDAIICASHGALYDISSGRCFGGPCKGETLHRADVEIRDGVIYATWPTAVSP